MLSGIAGALLTVVASWSLGRAVMRRLNLAWEFEFAAGSALLSAVLFALLVAGLGQLAVWLGLALLLLLGLYPPTPRWHPSMLWVPLVGFEYAALYLMHALSPEVQTDSLHYHLRFAVEAAASGRFPPGVSFYNVIPQGVETLFVMAYALGGGPAAKLLHLSFLIATIPLIQRVAARFGKPLEGWLAAGFYAVTPVVGMSATCGFNDAAMAFFTLAAFALMVEWWESGDGRLPWPAGLCAGFCYAIKFTGGLVAPAVIAAVVVRGRYRDMARPLIAAACMALPWIARAWLLTGNPVAPLMNSWFPNPHFHIETERELGAYLRSYGDLPWTAIPAQLAIHGDVLQGLLGPMWAAGVAALFALRNRSGRLLLAAAAFAALPWFFNIGARFLMPALPFVALALMTSIPRSVAITILALHAVLSWPSIVGLYAKPSAWTLKLAPADPKLGGDYKIASLVNHNTRIGDRILDLANAPAAITGRDLVNAWQTALGDRLVRSMHMASDPSPGQFVAWRAAPGDAPLDGVRIRFTRAVPLSAGIQDIRFIKPGGELLAAGALWTLRADPNIWEAPLAVDGSLATPWWTWEPVRPGMYYEIEFPGPERLARIEVIGHRNGAAAGLQIEVRRDGWQPIETSNPIPQAALNLRRPVIANMKREGITHILGQLGDDGFGRLSRDLVERSDDWNVSIAGDFDGVALVRVR